MEEEMINYINTQRVSVLAVKLLNGYPHGSVVHFAFDKESFSFIFMTSPTYKKYEPIKENGKTLASLVVGLSEEDMKTAQFDGEVKILEDKKLEEIYFSKFPEKVGKHAGDVFLIFEPNEWKYTDWNKPEGKTILDHTGDITVI